MVINLKIHPKLGEGVYGDVYEIDGKAYKLFLSYRFPQTEEKRRRTYHAQCEAYQRAARDATLQSHIAAFFGTYVIEDVVDTNGVSIRENYMLDCCYAMEVLKGNHAKVLAVRDSLGYLNDAYFEFSHKGFYLGDADVFNYDDPVGFKFIDFEWTHA